MRWIASATSCSPPPYAKPPCGPMRSGKRQPVPRRLEVAIGDHDAVDEEVGLHGHPLVRGRRDHDRSIGLDPGARTAGVELRDSAAALRAQLDERALREPGVLDV